MIGSRPLKKHEIAEIKTSFTGKMALRNLALFSIGANTGYRISELLSLTLGDVLDEQGRMKPSLTVKAENMKQGPNSKAETRVVDFNSFAQKGVTPWLRQLERMNVVNKDDFLFRSMYGGNRAIRREQAWKVLNAAYKLVGLKGKLGTHAMRKTFANNVYEYFCKHHKEGVTINPLRSASKALGHKDLRSTDKYLSFRREEVATAIEAVGV